MLVDMEYVELLVEHQPFKPRNRQELGELNTLLESLASGETKQSPALERFIRGLRQIDLAPILASKPYVSQILSGPRPMSKEAARKLAAFFQVSPYSFT